MRAPTDYDAIRQNETPEPDDDSLQMIKALHGDHSEIIDAVDTAAYAGVGLVADPSNLSPDEGQTMRVVPMKADEFTCESCFLIHPRSRMARRRRGRTVCRDCD